MYVLILACEIYSWWKIWWMEVMVFLALLAEGLYTMITMIIDMFRDNLTDILVEYSLSIHYDGDQSSY